MCPADKEAYLATIAITIQDIEEDGTSGVEVNVRSDTEMNDDTPLTAAQGMGLAVMAFLSSTIPTEEESGEAPSLEVVGDAG